MEQKPVLVIVKSTTCPHCKIFDAGEGPTLKKILNDRGRVRIVETDLTPTGGSAMLAALHPDLSRWSQWNPTFILVTAPSWNNKSGRLEGVVFNGEMRNEMAVHNSHLQKPSRPLKDIPAWIDTCLAGPPFTGSVAKGSGVVYVPTAGTKRYTLGVENEWPDSSPYD